MNNMYHFLKQFSCGAKAGKISKHPAAQIVAPTSEDAWKIFESHPKRSKNATYICRDVGLAGAEELKSGGQRKPGEWGIGDKCWTKLNPWDPDDPFYPARIAKVHESVSITDIEKKDGITSTSGFTVWILGDWSSCRFRRAEQILFQPPKGKKRRIRQRPAKQRKKRGKKGD